MNSPPIIEPPPPQTAAAPDLGPRQPFWRKHWILTGLAFILLVCSAIFASVYVHYARIVSAQVSAGHVQIGTMVFSTPVTLEVGQEITARDVVAHLERSGYRNNGTSRTGNYVITSKGLEITTGPDSYFQAHQVELSFDRNGLSRIFSRTNNSDSETVMLEPELVTQLQQGEREKRRPVQYSDLPPNLIKSLISIEDKRFFEHSGLDFWRAGKAAYVDLKEGRKEQGASTLTMQLARNFWLDQQKTWKRKFAEILISAELERRFNKEQILELYANEVYLGRRGSFSIHGFGQAARSYFNKDVRALTLPEGALLAGMIQRPSYYNPFKYPDRAKQRRDLVLTLMYNNGYLDAQQMASAQAAPITLRVGETETTDAPYFVDLVNGEVDDVLGDEDLKGQSFRVYTSLDMQLQREAVAAVHTAMAEVDKNARAKHKGKTQMPQVALVALDPRTGAVRALVGGRNYDQSQLNRALAKRPPGSSFKPFVYAAALSTAVNGSKNLMTPATVVVDEPTTFRFGKQEYSPGNFEGSYHGNVTLRTALMKSLNIPAVKVGEKVGFKEVVKLAKEAGMNENLAATPAVALGAYEVKPLEIAGAYTIFSNEGKLAPEHFVESARNRQNKIVYTRGNETKQVLDPRVAYLMVNMMEDVINRGTAAGARGRGFTLPAAGKTGTSHDGWFAGFTSELLTVVWVGYDDYTELDLEGAKSALPVWTEFMKRAHKLPQYRNAQPFKAPAGIARVNICNDTGQRATDFCQNIKAESFVEGTQPKQLCELHEFGYQPDGVISSDQQNSDQKHGFFGKVFGVFR